MKRITESTQLLTTFATLTLIAPSGGEGGIRTHGTDKGPLVFKTSAFDHSATSPVSYDQRSRGYMIIRQGKSRIRQLNLK